MIAIQRKYLPLFEGHYSKYGSIKLRHPHLAFEYMTILDQHIEGTEKEFLSNKQLTLQTDIDQTIYIKHPEHGIIGVYSETKQWHPEHGMIGSYSESER